MGKDQRKYSEVPEVAIIRFKRECKRCFELFRPLGKHQQFCKSCCSENTWKRLIKMNGEPQNEEDY